MKKNLTPKQNKFVKNLSKGYTQQDSAVLAGYSAKNASVISSQLIKKESIIKALDRVGLSDLRIAKGIKTNVDAGMGIKATADTSLRGLELASRLKGYLEREDTTQSLTQNNIYINELKMLDNNSLNSRLQSLLQEIASLKAK